MDDDELDVDEDTTWDVYPHRLTVADFLGVFFAFLANIFDSFGTAARSWSELLAGHSLHREQRRDFQDEARLEIEAIGKVE